MGTPGIAALVCPRGHGPGTAGTRFCNWCGAPLVAAAPGPAVYYQPPLPAPCGVCGGNGSRLESNSHICPQCRWLRPLVPGYQLDTSVFLWAHDGAAMATLRSIGPLNSAAKAISDKVGRPWIESTFNGVRLGPNQMPRVWDQAVLAARILGLSHMPDLYISGERMWDALTFGSDTNAFVLLGTALVTNFQGGDLLFVLAREMGHVRAGHALWKTVLRFLVGEVGPRRGLMSEGVLAALNPAKLLESAVEMPLMAWARQAEITADRAGLLAVGDQDLIRRVLLSWSLRSSLLFRQINVEAWQQQEEGSQSDLTRLSEMISSSTLYISRRLRLLTEFTREPLMRSWCDWVRNTGRPKAPVPAVKPAPAAPQPGPQPGPPAKARDQLRMVCSGCRAGMNVPLAALEGKETLNVRCPKCGKVFTLRKKAAAAAAASSLPAAEQQGQTGDLDS